MSLLEFDGFNGNMWTYVVFLFRLHVSVCSTRSAVASHVLIHILKISKKDETGSNPDFRPTFIEHTFRNQSLTAVCAL